MGKNQSTRTYTHGRFLFLAVQCNQPVTSSSAARPNNGMKPRSLQGKVPFPTERDSHSNSRERSAYLKESLPSFHQPTQGQSMLLGRLTDVDAIQDDAPFLSGVCAMVGDTQSSPMRHKLLREFFHRSWRCSATSQACY